VGPAVRRPAVERAQLLRGTQDQGSWHPYRLTGDTSADIIERGVGEKLDRWLNPVIDIGA